MHLLKQHLLICLLLVTGSVNAQASWLRAKSAHFIIYGDMREPSIRAIAEKLERFDAVMQHVTQNTNTDIGNPVTVFIVGSSGEIHRLSGNKNAAGFYQPTLSGNFAYVERDTDNGNFALTSQEILFHEYAHHYMFHYFPTGYPAWFIEGFAELYATTEINKEGQVTFGKPPYYRAYGLFNYGFDLTKMLTGLPAKLGALDG